jgi:hypothetical protein
MVGEVLVRILCLPSLLLLETILQAIVAGHLCIELAAEAHQVLVVLAKLWDLALEIGGV